MQEKLCTNKCNMLVINIFIQVLNVMCNIHSDQDQILLPGQICPSGSTNRQRLEACDLELVYIKTDGTVKECP